MTLGCHWERPGFSVYMRDVRKQPVKCDFCKVKDEKCKDCKDHSEFVDRGYILIDKRHKK
jgi:hypothetical protein